MKLTRKLRGIFWCYQSSLRSIVPQKNLLRLLAAYGGVRVYMEIKFREATDVFNINFISYCQLYPQNNTIWAFVIAKSMDQYTQIDTITACLCMLHHGYLQLEVYHFIVTDLP